MIVLAVIDDGAGPRPVGEVVAQAAGIEDAPWRVDLPVAAGTTGTGWVVATTTTGTMPGPPNFAAVTVEWAA